LPCWPGIFGRNSGDKLPAPRWHGAVLPIELIIGGSHIADTRQKCEAGDNRMGISGIKKQETENHTKSSPVFRPDPVEFFNVSVFR